MRGGSQWRRRWTDWASGSAWSKRSSSAGGFFDPAHGPDQPDDPGVADLGYRLLPRHWGKGLASEGARELVRYGLEDVGLDRVIAQTLAVNAGSRAVMERVGLSYVRGFSSSMTAQVEGLEAGEVEYEMTREQLRRRMS